MYQHGSDRQLSGRATVLLSALLFAAVLSLRASSSNAADATLVLFVVPIALCALAFGLRGGLGAAAVAIALLVGWEAGTSQGLSALGVAARTIGYLLVGGLLGRFVDDRRRLEAKVDRHFALSRDLFCTADLDGYFEELNPAWEQTLGYTTDELRSRPFVEFVHPDDRERTLAEAAKLATGISTVSFRNRYRDAAGQYRWLEWNVHPDLDEGRLYATARDVTIQQRAEEALKDQSRVLEATVRERTVALEDSRLELLQRLAVTAEYHDYDTRQHTERVGRTAALIGRELGLPEVALALIRRAAPLHDIGKVGISDLILRKRGLLTPAERKSMEQHAEIGGSILANGRFGVLRMAEVIARTHHERWDGTGYPNRLAGDAIPWVGRVTALADVFDALTHERPYKKAWPVPDAVAEIERNSGRHFDPGVVAAYMALDHHLLVTPIEDFDLDLPPPPLSGDVAERTLDDALPLQAAGT